jgi:hypothetical protein
MRKEGETMKERAIVIKGQVTEMLFIFWILALTLRSTEDVIPNSSAMRGKEGAIMDEANGSRNANSPIVTAAPLRTLLDHWRGSMAVV